MGVKWTTTSGMLWLVQISEDNPRAFPVPTRRNLLEGLVEAAQSGLVSTGENTAVRDTDQTGGMPGYGGGQGGKEGRAAHASSCRGRGEGEGGGGVWNHVDVRATTDWSALLFWLSFAAGAFYFFH